VLNKRFLPKTPRQFFCGLCLYLCLGPVAWALESCDTLLSAQPPDLTTAQLLARAAALESQCAKNGNFLYQYGRLLNLAGRYGEALDRLEGAVLHRPDHWPSQVEYAIALEGAGDAQSAAGLLDNLVQNPDLDPATRRQIVALRQKTTPAAAAPQISLTLAAGYDDNLLGDTRHNTIELTLPGGQLPVAIDEEQRPHAAAFLRTEVGLHDDMLATQTGLWRYALFASHRASPAYPAARLDNLAGYVEHLPAQAHGLYALAGQQAFARNGASLLRQTQVMFGYEAPLRGARGCQQRLALDLQRLAYPVNPTLNGRYLGAVALTHCADAAIELALRLGQDQPQNPARPGGRQDHYGVRLSKKLQLDQTTLTVEGEYTSQQDQSGYSPLLKDNAPRHIRRTTYRLEGRRQWASYSAFMLLEWVDQRSNLPLFDVNNRVITVGLQRKW